MSAVMPDNAPCPAVGGPAGPGADSGASPELGGLPSDDFLVDLVETEGRKPIGFSL